MPPRIRTSATWLALILIALAIAPGIEQRTLGTAAHAVSDAASYVNPFIGTEVAPANLHLGAGFDNGNVFPGAAYPHGMVQWSPDTTNAPGGYRYTQDRINGFSLTHFSGRGCSSYQDFPFIPISNAQPASPAQRHGHSTAIRLGPANATFSHNDEQASPGYYHVRLDAGYLSPEQGPRFSMPIDVALTVTARTGMAQFTYPALTNAGLLINAAGSATGNSDSGTGIQIVGSDEVVGEATSGHFCGHANTYTVYFAAIFDHPFLAFGTWDGKDVLLNSRAGSGRHAGVYLAFDATQNPVVQVKAGLSFVSAANAQVNLQAENPGWDFQAVREQARAAWNAHLGLIAVTGGTTSELQTFYTALYHCFLHPNVFSDVNGQYTGFDGQVHLAQGYTQYENFPGWDMYRSLIDLLALVEPRETSDMMQSLVADAQQGGGGLPRWEVANDNSAGMLGDSPDVLIAAAYAFGARNFDTQGAWQAMDAGASQVGTRSGRYEVREGLADYLRLGYVARQKNVAASASMTLEYAIDDFAIAQYARSLRKADAYATYLARSHNWQLLFNPATGYSEPRNANGTFPGGFDPTSEKGFAEGNAAQYSWLVPQELGGLFTMMGGNSVAIDRLDTFFTQLNAGPTSPYAFMGNEPSFEVPWEYDAAGAAYKTQEVVRRIQTQLFGPGPDGLPGNDDGGALSSWYVFSALGLYPEIPGVAGFFLGSPLFPQATIHMGNGHTLQIAGQGASEAAPYVQSLHLNGQAYNDAWLPFDAIANGANLQFALASSPNTAWAQ